MYTAFFNIKGPDIDVNYLLKPVALAQFFQEAFAYQCADLKLAAYDLQQQDMSWIMTDFRMEFCAPLPRWREQVRLEIWTSEIKGLRLFQDFSAYHQDTLLSSGTSGWLIINEKTRRPCPIHTVSEKFQVIAQKALPDFRFRKITLPEALTTSHQLPFKVRSMDIDFNHHLNSIRYLELALESIPIEWRNSQQLTSFQVKYSKEAYLGDELSALAFPTDKGFIHQLIRDKDQEELCRLSTEWGK